MRDPQPELRAIFCAALDQGTGPERCDFLDKACQGNPELRQRVDALLRAHEEASGFLQEPAEQKGGTVDRPFVAEPPGTIIGPYKLRELIGEGGMGMVFVAEQQRPVRRKLALKIIKPGMGTRDVIARFEAERQALALMDHPNIAKVFDAGTTESGQPYFVMELVKGVPIVEYCDQQQLTARQRLELFVTVCQAVQHAHQKGIIHRDLKPSNVLVAPHDGVPVVKVIDFGVAKAIGQQLTDVTIYTRFNQMIGTPLYMSPEQAEVNALDVDVRSDIYSLGVLLYELLTGTTPFDRQRFAKAAFDEIRRIIREEEPPRPSTRFSTLGQAATVSAHRQGDPRRLTELIRGELDWIVMKALEKDRNRRYESASAFAADVQRYLHDEPVLACPPSLAYRLYKLARRRKGPVLAASLVVLALVVGIIGTTWGMIRATDARGVAQHEAAEKQAALATALQSEQAAKAQLYEALLNRARAGRFSRQMGQRRDSLQAIGDAASTKQPGEQLRDEAIATLALPDVCRVPGWRSTPPGTAVMAYGGQYRLYARADSQGNISIRSIPDDREIQHIVWGPIQAEYLFFSPDERFLLGLGAGSTLGLWRVADGRPALEYTLRGCQSHTFSPDGRQLVVSRDQGVFCFDLTTGREVRRFRLAASARSLAFHPDSSKLAVGYFNARAASVYDVASGALIADLSVGTMSDQVVAWHPDGERLAVAGTDPRIQIWNVAIKRKVATLEGHAQRATSLSFHPDGELLASHGWDGHLLVWHPSSGRLLMRLTAVSSPHFSADGRWMGVAWNGDQADLLEVTPTREYRTLVSSAGAGQGSYGYFADISPDGRFLVAGMDDGARLWDLRNGRELAALPAGTSFAFFEGRKSDHPTPPYGASWALLTSGLDGLLRWPITRNDPAGERLSIGPPRRLSRLGRAWFTHCPDGVTLGTATEEGGANQILNLETGEVRRTLGSHPEGEVQALSPDGRWAASSGWHSDRVRLLNAGTGEMVKEWILGKWTTVYFTPDSRALVISRGNEFSFWDVETKQLIRQLPRHVTPYPGWVAFSPDGRLMALEMAPAIIHLKEVATGRTVATLEDPHGDRANWQGFTPDGTQLVVVTKYACAIHLWDLRAIRARLKDMNLDWDWPEFPPASIEGPAAAPVKFEVRLGDLAKPALTREQRARKTIERSRRAASANPEAASACNDLAWAYLMAPAALCDVTAALLLAEKAVRLEPKTAIYCNTLGVAYYRAGRYREAIEVLRPNLEKQEDWALAFDLYFLAMSYHRLGETGPGRAYYEWAIRWSPMQSVGPEHLGELTALRAEAEELFSSPQP